MIKIGYDTDIDAEVLYKCVLIGTTPTKLTRCLVDVIFTNVKLLASCSAFGGSSNSGWSQAALPARKVNAIIEFVRRQFPTVDRSEIICTINRKCEEAKIIFKKFGDQKPELTKVSEGTQANSSVTSKTGPNLICIRSADSIRSKLAALKTKPSSVFTNPPVRILPKPVKSKSAEVVQLSAAMKPKNPTVKELLFAKNHKKVVFQKPFRNSSNGSPVMRLSGEK